VEAVRECIRVGYDLDTAEVERQAQQALEPGVTRMNWWPHRCVFLDSRQRCAIWQARPLACRAVSVVSDPKRCENPSNTVERIDNRKEAAQAGRAIQAEHMQLAMTPTAAALSVMVQLVLEGNTPAILGKHGLVGLEGEMSNEEVDARFVARVRGA
jgi:Fe-S-cluster containining protein